MSFQSTQVKVGVPRVQELLLPLRVKEIQVLGLSLVVLIEFRKLVVMGNLAQLWVQALGLLFFAQIQEVPVSKSALVL